MGNVFHNRASLLPQCSLFRSFQLTLLVISSVHPQGWQPRMQETRNEDLHSHEMDWGALWWILILASLLLSNFCCYALCSSFATTLPTKVLHFILFCNSCDVYLWPFKFHFQFLENCVSRAPLLHLRSWVALSFKVCQASVTSGQISTFFVRHKGPYPIIIN